MQVGTPLCIPDRGNLVIGKVTSIEANRLEVPLAKKGANVAIKIEPTAEQSYITCVHLFVFVFGRPATVFSSFSTPDLINIFL